MVEACIYEDGDNCCEDQCGREDNKRKGPVLISVISEFLGKRGIAPAKEMRQQTDAGKEEIGREGDTIKDA